MTNSLHLPEIALTVVLVAALAIPVFGQKPVQEQSISVPAVPSVPGRYDLQWETYTVRSAPSGKAFYVFEGRQPVGIAVLGADVKPEIFPIVSGAAAEELKVSFERFKRARGVGATFLSKTSTAGSITLSTLLAPKGGGTPSVAFDTNGMHVSLNEGTRVEFLAANIEVTMPAAIPSLPATTISFDSRVKAGATGQALGEIGLTMNGQPINVPRTGPLWDGLKNLVLMPALYKAAQAAQIVRSAAGWPADTPDYVALVAGIEIAFGIVPISFF